MDQQSILVLLVRQHSHLFKDGFGKEQKPFSPYVSVAGGRRFAHAHVDRWTDFVLRALSLPRMRRHNLAAHLFP